MVVKYYSMKHSEKIQFSGRVLPRAKNCAHVEVRYFFVS